MRPQPRLGQNTPGSHARSRDLPRPGQSSAGDWGGQTSWGVVRSVWHHAQRMATFGQKRAFSMISVARRHIMAACMYALLLLPQE